MVFLSAMLYLFVKVETRNDTALNTVTIVQQGVIISEYKHCNNLRYHSGVGTVEFQDAEGKKHSAPITTVLISGE